MDAASILWKVKQTWDGMRETDDVAKQLNQHFTAQIVLVDFLCKSYPNIVLPPEYLDALETFRAETEHLLKMLQTRQKMNAPARIWYGGDIKQLIGKVERSMTFAHRILAITTANIQLAAAHGNANLRCQTPLDERIRQLEDSMAQNDPATQNAIRTSSPSRWDTRTRLSDEPVAMTLPRHTASPSSSDESSDESQQGISTELLLSPPIIQRSALTSFPSRPDTVSSPPLRLTSSMAFLGRAWPRVNRTPPHRTTSISPSYVPARRVTDPTPTVRPESTSIPEPLRGASYDIATLKARYGTACAIFDVESAVQTARELHRLDPGDSRSLLASALEMLATKQSMEGKIEEAIESWEDVVSLWEWDRERIGRAAKSVGWESASLQIVTGSLLGAYSALSQCYQEANGESGLILELDEKALALEERLFEFDNEGRRQHYAVALLHLTEEHVKNQRWGSAAETGMRTIPLLRTLHERDPPAHRADFAHFLRTVSRTLARLDRADEQLAILLEAIALFRQTYEAADDADGASRERSLAAQTELACSLEELEAAYMKRGWYCAAAEASLSAQPHIESLHSHLGKSNLEQYARFRFRQARNHYLAGRPAYAYANETAEGWMDLAGENWEECREALARASDLAALVGEKEGKMEGMVWHHRDMAEQAWEGEVEPGSLWVADSEE